MRAVLYARVSAADVGVSTPDLLAELRHYAVDVRRWEVGLELADRGPGIAGHRAGLATLVEAIRERRVDVVVTTSLARLCRSQSHVIDVADLLEADPRSGLVEVALVSLKDMIDTTTPDGRVRWRDAVGLFRAIRHQQRSEAVKLAKVKAAVRGVDDSWGRPIAVINPLELMGYWHGSEGQRPLSVREIARKLGYSQGTVRGRIRELLDGGRLRPEVRERNLAAAGGLRKGGRPIRSRIDPGVLASDWNAGTPETTLRRRFRCGAERLQRLLRELRETGKLDDEHREKNQRRRR